MRGQFLHKKRKQIVLLPFFVFYILNIIIESLTLLSAYFIHLYSIVTCLILYNLKFGVDDFSNLIEFIKYVLVPHFIEHIFWSGSTLFSSWDCSCHEDSKQTVPCKTLSKQLSCWFYLEYRSILSTFFSMFAVYIH